MAATTNISLVKSISGIGGALCEFGPELIRFHTSTHVSRSRTTILSWSKKSPAVKAIRWPEIVGASGVTGTFVTGPDSFLVT
jgi:hypothetical protein